jgi:hypothetical protein
MGINLTQNVDIPARYLPFCVGQLVSLVRQRGGDVLCPNEMYRGDLLGIEPYSPTEFPRLLEENMALHRRQ